MAKTWNILGTRVVDGRTTIVTVATIHDPEYHGEWMEDCYVTFSVKSPTPVDFQFGDYMFYRNERFEINYDLNIIKKARSGSYGEGFTYDNIKMYSIGSRLKFVEFKDYVLNDKKDTANQLVYSSQSMFSFFAQDVDDLADRIQANLNRVYGNKMWSVYTPNPNRTAQRISVTSKWNNYYSNPTDFGKTEIDISVQNIKCWDALKMSYTHFELSYYIKGTDIIIGGKPIAAEYDFEYGKSNGLYEIERTFDESQNIITMLYAYGSERNIPINYYANLHKRTFITGNKLIYTIIYDQPIYAIITSLTKAQIESKITTGKDITISNGTTEINGWFDYMYEIENLQPDGTGWNMTYAEVQYLRLTFDYHNPAAKSFFDSYNNGGKLYINGVNINTWPEQFVENTAASSQNYPALLSINRLMLPGFPDKSLYAWVTTPVDFGGGGGVPIDSATGKARWRGYTAYFSTDKNDPWIKSVNADKIGVREGTLNFDSDEDEIYPTIEGTGFDEVLWAEQIYDNGYVDDGSTFELMPAKVNNSDGGIEWNYKRETVSISMKDGYCVGREFTVKNAKPNENGDWVLTLERRKDDSLGIYFPYKYGNTNLYNIWGRGNHQGQQEGDHFVVLGVPLPNQFVEIAAAKLLEKALEQLAKYDHQQYTYLPKIDEIEMARQHDRAMASGGSIVSVHDSIYAGMQMRIDDDDLNVHYAPFIDNITIKENGNNGVPTYDVVLRDEKEMTMQEKIQSEIKDGQSAVLNALDNADYSGEFLSKRYDDTANGLITFLQGLLIGNYVTGVSGGRITAEGDAELNTLITRGLAELKELFVVNNSTFGGNLSSIEFISGFLDGKGWALQKKSRINSLGVEEEYYSFEIDEITVRETLRVYEFVVSQLRGEFDNYVFASMMEVHHYDTHTGKVWLYTEGGKIKAVPFRAGDYIMVQQYQAGNDIVSGGDGYITKHYELVVLDSGTGGETDENGDRLDWITFKNFTTTMEGENAVSLIQKKDTFVRVDNEKIPERKGLMQVITVGPNTPYMDVNYGLKTDPFDALKVRIGNLSGIRTEQFGWLEGFGAYLPNLYSVGKMFNRQTGESFNSSLDITRERLKSVYSETVYNISEEDNFLKNGFFVNDLQYWDVCKVDGSAPPSDPAQEVINSGDGTALMVNGAILQYQSRLTAEVTEYSGARVLHLLGMGVSQSFANIKDNETHKEIANSTYDEPEYEKETEEYWKRLYPEQSAAWIAQQIAYWEGVNASREQDAEELDDEEDRLYMGIRILPISAGTLTVSFLKSNGTLISDWSEELNATRVWSLVQEADSEADPWAYTGESGKMVVGYTGECYIRFIALMSDPISNTEENYNTLFEQTARRITLQATKNDKYFAEFQIQANAIIQTVTNNKAAEERHLYDLLGITVNANGTYTFPAGWVPVEGKYDYSSWRIQTASVISDIVSKWDPVTGDLIGYSTTIQTADAISNAVYQVDSKREDLMYVEDWEQGGTYAGTSGISGMTYDQFKKAAQNEIRTKKLIALEKKTSFTLNEGWKLNIHFFNSNGGYISSIQNISQYLGKYNLEAGSIPQGTAQVALSLTKDNTATLYASDVLNSGISRINYSIVTSAELSLYVDKDSMSWLQGTADNIIFRFSNQFHIYSGNSTDPLLWIDPTNGDLYITGEFHGKISGDTYIQYNSTGTNVDGIRLTSTGIERRLPNGSWINLFADRYVQYLNYTASDQSKTLSNYNNFVITNGNHDKIVKLPPSPTNGKIITIKNIGGTLRIRPNTGQDIRDTDTPETEKQLNAYGRAELVFYGITWYWNYIGV